VSAAVPVTGEFRTVTEVMDAAVEQIGERDAYVDVATDRRLTFREWVEAADAAAAALADRGVRAGDVVAIALSPSIEYAIAYAAVARLGAVATGINTRLGRREVTAIFERCAPVVVVQEPGAVLPLGATATAVRPADLEARTPGGPGRVPDLRPGQPDDPVTIIWTSGTTGVPKGAWFDHRNLAAAVDTAGPMTQAFDRRISGVPMAHAGYMAKLWEQFAMGVALVLTPTPWTAESMLRVLVDERITAGAGVPTQWAKLLDVAGIGDADLSALRVCLAAAAPAPPDLVERMREVLGCPVIVRYAMTESPSITSTDPDDPPDVQYRTVGRAVPRTTVDLVDDAGRTVPPGAVGRVRVTGPCVMRGYWRDPERTADVIDDRGRLLSGDAGRFDGAGNLVLVGRSSEMYIRGGYNVYPLEVEHVLAEHPGVAAAAVVGAPRPVIGEIGVAFVVPADPADAPGRDALRAWVAGQLADYKAPDEVRLVEALPLTPLMKVDKVALRAEARDVDDRT
jgi:acyl-CoA synthetase (AMP-forming)/AMP-acid ligase II